MTKVICAMFLLGMLAAPLGAQISESNTTRGLVDACTATGFLRQETPRDPLRAYQTGYCHGYFRSVLIMNSMLVKAKEMGYQTNAWFCAPVETSTDQARLIFLSYVKDHPKTLNENVDVTVIGALIDQFPCKRD